MFIINVCAILGRSSSLQAADIIKTKMASRLRTITLLMNL